jgi:hypothetical protein
LDAGGGRVGRGQAADKHDRAGGVAHGDVGYWTGSEAPRWLRVVTSEDEEVRDGRLLGQCDTDLTTEVRRVDR